MPRQTQKVPLPVSSAKPQRGKASSMIASVSGQDPSVGTRRSRTNKAEHLGSQLRIVVSNKRATNEAQGAHGDGRVIAPVPFHPDMMGFSTTPHREGLGVKGVSR